MGQDHRQTRPFVASDDFRDNPWAPQMLVSMMERADRAGAIRNSLLINHRAYGGLQRLASCMFYNQKMISGYSEDELFPPSVQHLQRFLERFMDPGSKCREPRLIAYSPNRGEVRVGTSWFNEDHGNWVMERVAELLSDPMFRQVGKTDRGTILIIAPYKEAYMKYKKSIQNFPKAWAARLGVERRVEARTIDTVQGGEADIVFLDMVRSTATDFTDDPNRLCVALTRARQAEVILMHPGSKYLDIPPPIIFISLSLEALDRRLTPEDQCEGGPSISPVPSPTVNGWDRWLPLIERLDRWLRYQTNRRHLSVTRLVSRK